MTAVPRTVPVIGAGIAGLACARSLEEPLIAAHRLLEAFAVALGGLLPAWLHCDAHRWRYALPETPIGEACLWDAELRLGACGDSCLEGRVEAAFDSGRRLAQRISKPDGGAAGEPIA